MNTTIMPSVTIIIFILHLHLSLNHRGCWRTTCDLTTSFPHFSVFLCPLGLAKLQACPFPDVVFPPLFLSAFSDSCLFPYFTVSCKMVLARPDEWEKCPCHFSLCLSMIVRPSVCSLIACWILALTSSLVTWSLYEMHGILR